jgi:hypothetical protein
MKDVFYGGVILGIGIAFWHTLLFFTCILGFCYLIDKRIFEGVAFLFEIGIGLLPLFALDVYLFALPGYTLLKTLSGTFVIMLGGSVGALHSEETLEWLRIVLVLAVFPVSFWLLYRTRMFMKHWREGLFLSLSLLVILSNPQLRYTLVLVPIAVLVSYTFIPARYYRNALLLSGALALFVSVPYLFQINGSLTPYLGGVEITGVLEQRDSLHYRSSWPGHDIAESLRIITIRYPNERFLVGPDADSYQTLAHLAWELPIAELVSMQDYAYVIENRSSYYEKTIHSTPRISERRLLTITGALKANPAVLDIASVEYALGIDTPVTAFGFREIVREGRIYLSQKE